MIRNPDLKDSTLSKNPDFLSLKQKGLKQRKDLCSEPPVE